MSKKKETLQGLHIKVIYIKLLTVFVIPPLVAVVFLIYFGGRIYPGIRVDGVAVGGMSITDATTRLSQNVIVPSKIQVNVANSRGDVETYEILTADIGLVYQHEQSAFSAFSLGRRNDIWTNIKTIVMAAINGANVDLQYGLDHEKLSENVYLISGVVENKPEYPRIDWVNDSPQVFEGKPGVALSSATLYKLIAERIQNGELSRDLSVSVQTVDPRLTLAQINDARTRASKLKGRRLVVRYDEREFEAANSLLFSFINPVSLYNDNEVLKFATFVSRELDREPQNPVFVFTGGRVSEFEPALKGLRVNTDELTSQIYFKLLELESGDVATLELLVKPEETPPPFDISDVNNLGIHELIGRGTSRFKGSIASRIHNIAIAASRLDGMLISPGKEFSFNQAVGDISVLTGYKQAYIIENGATVLGDGGGVCQVSTTLFRAALDAGLPITNRRAHAYRVSYYELGSPPGIDATIYSPSVDFKFKNDTPSYILIQAKPDTKNLSLAIELYGTDDGRESNISKPLISSVTPPPEDLYIDDPNLPTGQTKQTDHSAWGAKVSFNYKVTRGEEVIQEKTFYSNYQAWQAKYLRGTGPAI